MKDTIIKETGNSRFLRSNIAEDITFAEFIALLRAGQLPIDLAGINEEGIETLGMALSKGNLLNEETEMTIWGDVGDRTPTNALKKIYETFSAGLAEKAKIVTGTYTGNNASKRSISLGFRPKAVVLARQSASDHKPMIALDGVKAGTISSSTSLNTWDDGTEILIHDSGFYVGYNTSADYRPETNNSLYTFIYIAIA